MDKANLDDSLKLALVELKQYLELLFKYNKLLLAKKMGELSSFFILFLLLLGISSFFLLFISLAFADWFSYRFQLPYLGNLIIAGFYLLVILFLVLFRKSLIFNPLRKLFGDIFFEEDEAEEVAMQEVFASKEVLNLQIKSYRSVIREQEEKLNKEFTDLGEVLTFTNIIQTLFRKAYQSIFTTTNVARAAYHLAKRITSKRKTKGKLKKRTQSGHGQED